MSWHRCKVVTKLFREAAGADFKGAASKGSVYVEFDVPSSGLLQGGKEGWYKMIGPDASKTQQYLLNRQGGEHLPEVKNITVLDSK